MTGAQIHNTDYKTLCAVSWISANGDKKAAEHNAANVPRHLSPLHKCTPPPHDTPLMSETRNI